MVFYLQQDRKSLFTDPYKAISQRACIVIETIDIQSFMNSLSTGEGLFGTIEEIKEFEPFNRKLKYLADQLNKPGMKKLLNDGTAVISFFPDEGGKIQPLLSMSIPGEIRIRHIKEILLSFGIKEVIEKKLPAGSLLKIPFSVNSKKDTAYISLISGLMVCAGSEKLIEESRIQTGKEYDVRSLPGFSRVLLSSGKNEDKIFVIFSNLKQLIKSILKTESQGLTERISRLAATAEGDIFINEEGIVLSGYTETTDSSESLFKYKSLSPQAFDTYKILPSSTVLFETFVVRDSDNTKISGPDVPEAGTDPSAKFSQYIGQEITRAYVDIKDRPVEDNTFIIYELTDRVRAEQLFLEELGTEKEILYFEPDDQLKIPVYKTAKKGLNRSLQSGFAFDPAESYFAFYDNYLIYGSSYVTISRILYDNLLNKTLANDLTYRDFESSLPSRAGYFFYCVPWRIIDYLTGYLNEELISALKANKKSINKIQSAGYQLASSNSMIYSSLSIRFKEEAAQESTTEWETLLDTVASIKPFFFTNHISGAKEIFVQDMKNNTYLINMAGRVLWKVPLKERITGTVYMIDYFRNGKYQLLFSGRNNIHLLDRNGNYVERYPVKLRSPATNSIALFDYDNNKNYRLFIAGEDKQIYSYDKTGNVVKGWKLFRTAGLVKSEISYFRVSGKDYIVASDETSVYFLDRTGNKRLNLKEQVNKARGSSLRLNPGSEPSVICSSPDGTVQQIFFDGNIKKFSLSKFSVDHSSDFFDIDGDGFGEYIFIDKGILYLYDHNKTELFTREFESMGLGGPINFIFSAGDRKIGVFDNNKKLIYLIDKNGETMNGFPLRGASMFSIGKLSEKSGWHLIVGGTDRFLYNYKIETDTN